MKHKVLAITLLFAATLPASHVTAQPTDKITIQLNGAETTGTACRLTFVIQNRLNAPVEALGLDLVMFDQSEGVSGYAAVDFGAMPSGKTIVRQYDVGQNACTDVSRVLLNEVRTCESGGAVLPDCMAKLDLSSRSEIGFIL